MRAPLPLRSYSSLFGGLRGRFSPSRGSVRVMVASWVLATVVVGIALHFRQEPARTGSDAYLPMRTLSPMEAAALLTAEAIHDPDRSRGGIIERVDRRSVSILTGWYVVEVESPSSSLPESQEVVQVSGRFYRLVASSWEGFVCRYRIPREPLEKILGKTVAPIPAGEVIRPWFVGRPVSFSSERVALYFVIETAMLALLFGIVGLIFAKAHALLWLPFLMALTSLLFPVVALYSPAFVDADWFHQRIVIESVLLLAGVPFRMMGALGVYLCLLSLIAYILVRVGRYLVAGKRISAMRYRGIVIAVLSVMAMTWLAAEATRYGRAAADAHRLIEGVRGAFNSSSIPPLLDFLKQSGLDDHTDFIDDRRLPESARVMIDGILSPRTRDAPVLRVLIPFEDRYVFLWADSSFRYADIRPLQSSGSHIGDYERIQPAIDSMKSYRTGFGTYLMGRVERVFSEYVRVEILTDTNGTLSAVIVSNRDRRP